MELTSDSFGSHNAQSNLGDAEARYMVALHHLEGVGVKRSSGLAAKFMLSAFNLGSPSAIMQMEALKQAYSDHILIDSSYLSEALAETSHRGRLLYFGLKLREQNKDSVYQRAVAGERIAMYDLAIGFIYGALGFKKNADRGLSFMGKAIEAGLPEAIEWAKESGHKYGIHSDKK